MALIHEHLIIRAVVENPPTDTAYMETWIRTLVDRIGMKILMGPYAAYSEMCGNRGLTVVTVIETSHIAFHSWDEESPGMVQLDVYSCAPVDKQVVLDMLQEFEPVFVDYKFLDRSKNFIKLEN